MDQKNIIQEKAVALAQDNNLLLSWATGTGKSLAALKIAATIPNKKWYIVCKEIPHIKNWYNEFKKHKINPSNFEVFCYDSLHKYSDTEANLILDEVHSLTPLRISLLLKIKFNKVICLSALVPDEKKELLKSFISFTEYHISLSEAIELKLIPMPKIYIVDVFLKNSEPTEIHILKKGNKDKRQIVKCSFKDRYTVFRKYTDVELHIMCTQQEKYLLINAEIDYYKTQYFKIRKEWAQYVWLQATLKRKNYLADIKTEKAKEILSLLKDKRLICFTGSIDQCNMLGKDYAIHSETNTDNNEIITKFNNLEISKLFAVKMLREGVNLEQIDSSLIIQLDNQILSFIQMLGRCIRGLLPECYILVVKNTQDEVYLNTALTGFNTDYLYKFSDLKLGKTT